MVKSVLCNVSEGKESKESMDGNSECIVRDEESLERFYILANKLSYTISKRYPEVSFIHHPKDVVQEVLVDVISNNICFDASRGKKYKNFIFMLLSNKYSDLFRKLDANKRKTLRTVPFDSLTSNDFLVVGKREYYSHIDNKLPLEDILEGKDYYYDKLENDMLLEGFIKLLKSTYTSLGLKQGKKLNIFKIIELRFAGYRNIDIANMFGVRPARISLTLKRNRERLWDVWNTFMDDRIELPHM
jgi:DNA-directed RNA polymerase specialized sigma24 family protein